MKPYHQLVSIISNNDNSCLGHKGYRYNNS